MSAPLVATLLVLASVAGAPAPPCPLERAAQIFDFAGGQPPLPVEFYAVGFSPSGRFAWLEQPRFEEKPPFTWWLSVVDLGAGQRLLGKQAFRTRAAGLRALCREHGAEVMRALAPHGIEPGSGMPLPSTPDDLAVWTRAELRQGPTDVGKGRTRFDVFLRGPAGPRRLGSLWRPDPGAGEAAAALPRVVGIVWNGLGPRVAVLVGHAPAGTRAAQTVQVWCFGARLAEGPSGGERPLPRELTQAWLRQLEQGGWSLARVVDPARGLVVIHHEVDSGKENDPGHVSAERLCGDELARRLPGVELETVAEIRHSDITSCHNRPDPPTCVVGVAMEYASFTHLVFVPGTDGKLRLDAILHLDSLSSVDDPEAHREQADYVANELRRLRATDCAGNAAAQKAKASPRRAVRP
jgi:hypothetical protein